MKTQFTLNGKEYKLQPAKIICNIPSCTGCAGDPKNDSEVMCWELPVCNNREHDHEDEDKTVYFIWEEVQNSTLHP